jgi:hypothetical protein
VLTNFAASRRLRSSSSLLSVLGLRSRRRFLSFSSLLRLRFLSLLPITPPFFYFLVDQFSSLFGGLVLCGSARDTLISQLN